MIEFIKPTSAGNPQEYTPSSDKWVTNPASQDIILQDTGTAVAKMAEQVTAMAAQMTAQMAAMAEMMRMTNERMAELEKTVRTLEKVTPQQITAINKAIRDRAKEVCEDYLAEGAEKMAGAAIRQAVRKMTGAQATREICRCDAGTAIRFIQEWDDPGEMRKIRKKVGA